MAQKMRTPCYKHVAVGLRLCHAMMYHIPLGLANKEDEPEKALVADRAAADLPVETKAVAGASREASMMIFIVPNASEW